jgi:hypothetical protein
MFISLCSGKAKARRAGDRTPRRAQIVLKRGSRRVSQPAAMRAGRERLPGEARKGRRSGSAHDENARNHARRLAAAGLRGFALEVHLRSVVVNGSSSDHSTEEK